MSKANKKKKIQRNLHLTDNEKLLVRLHAISEKMNDKSESARSLIAWYMTHKEWTYKQLCFVKRLCNHQDLRKKDEEKPKKKYNLYAFSDDESIKVGISTNVGARMREIQTSHDKRLNCVWKYYTGTERTHGYKMEKKLHRLLKDHRLIGEWFKVDALDKIKSFSCPRMTIERNKKP